MILDTFRLDGRVALVTGTSRGLGQAAAVALAEAGADVALLDRTPADETAAMIQALGRRTHSLELDLISATPDQLVAAVDEVILGCANQAGEDNRNVARMAVLLSGLPVEVPGVTVNRLCASGLDGVMMAARAIRSGDMDLVIAGGVESMTRAPFVMPKAGTAWERSNAVFDTTIGWRFVNKALEAEHGVDSMPQTAQNVADRWNVSREDQDAFALRSQQRTAAAQASGRLAREIVPVTVPVRRGDPVVVEADEHPRPTTAEVLAKLRPIFSGGSVTAGNSSGVNDGAVAVLVASEAAVQRYGLSPLARITSGASVGVEPRVMGIGPHPAVDKLLSKKGLGVSDIDLFELNEAFASQALQVLRGLGLPDDADHVNPNGGAIALGPVSYTHLTLPTNREV